MDSVKLPVDSSKTFYQKTDSSELSNIMSKYKKKRNYRISTNRLHPPEDDPHKEAQLDRKNEGKRLAHKRNPDVKKNYRQYY